MPSSLQKSQHVSQITFPIDYQFRQSHLEGAGLNDLEALLLDAPLKILKQLFTSYSDLESQELISYISAIRRSPSQISKYLENWVNQFNIMKYLSLEDLPHLVKDLFIATNPKVTPNMRKVFQSAPIQPGEELRQRSETLGLSYQATAQAFRELQQKRILHEYYLINYTQLHLTPLMLFTPNNFLFSSKYTVMSQPLLGGENTRWYFLTYPTTQLPILLDLLFLRDDNLSTYGIATHVKDTVSYSLLDEPKTQFRISHEKIIEALIQTPSTANFFPPTDIQENRKILAIDVQLAYHLSNIKTTSNHFLSETLDKSEGYLSERKRQNLNRNILYPSYDLSHLGLKEETFILTHQPLPQKISQFFDIFPKTRHIQLSTPLNTPCSLIMVTGTLGTNTLISHFLTEHYHWSNFQMYTRFTPNTQYLISPDLFIETSQSWQIDTPSILFSMDSEK